MLERLYHRTMGLAAHRHALWVLALVSFIESSVFPIPPDVLLVPMVLARRRRAWRIAAVCTAGSVLGGLAGYSIGYFLFESLGRPLIDLYGHGEQFARFQASYNAWGWWIVTGAGLTPFPYKVVTIASGVTGLDMATFVLASLLSRGARFFAEAGLLWYFGPSLRAFIERRMGLVATVFFLLLLGGFVLVGYVL